MAALGRLTVQIEIDSCLQCCAFHPSASSLLAGGTFFGAQESRSLHCTTIPCSQPLLHMCSAITWIYCLQFELR